MSLPAYNICKEDLLHYEQLLPKHTELFHALGICFHDESDYKTAAYYFKKALTINASAVLDWIKVAYSIESSGDFAGACPYYAQAHQQTPQDTWLLQRYGWCYLQSQQYEKGIEILLKCTALNPQDSWAWGKIGYCYQMLGDYQAALKYHLEADQIGSTEPAWNTANIGYCYQMNKDYDTALEYHLKAEQQDESDTWNLKNCGYCYQQKGEYQTALNYHERVAEQLPEDVWNLKNLGYCWQKLGDYRRAIEFHLQVEKLLPDNAWNLGHLGYCYQRIEEYETALEYHRRVTHLDANDNWNRGQLGYCYYVLGDISNAHQILEHCTDKYSYLHLGSIYLIQGRQKKAVEYYQKSVFMFDDQDEFFRIFDNNRGCLDRGYVASWIYNNIRSDLEEYAQLKNVNLN